MTSEEIKKLKEEMPYLIPGDYHGNKIDCDYIEGQYDIPEGWLRLYIQMCKDIKEPLEKAGLLDKFYFAQVKEKYDELTVYTYNSIEEVEDIIEDYAYMSYFICNNCGKLGDYVITSGWISTYCKDCFTDEMKENSKYRDISLDRMSRSYSKVGGEKTTRDLTNKWNRYLGEK